MEYRKKFSQQVNSTETNMINESYLNTNHSYFGGLKHLWSEALVAVEQVIENRFHQRFEGGLVCYQGPQESSFSIILTLFQTCRLVPNCELVENTV